MSENEFKYWAFLSHSREDNGGKRPDAPDASHLCWGDWLREALLNFSIPADFAGHPNARGEIVPERLEPVFQDTEEQPDNASLSEGIRQALEQSRCLIVICSPRSARSLHVNEAVRYFKQLGRGNRILSLVVAGEPNASDANKPGVSPADECLVPALRHPVLPDGTLDVSRREGGHIFADARHGVEKREILATDHRSAETELEIAKLQLIAGLSGVGFNGLWKREQKRRFVGFAEAQHQAREAQDQLEQMRHHVREAQNKILEGQNLPQDVRSQIQEAQDQALQAQALARNTQSQLDAARQQVQEAQGKLLEAQRQVEVFQNQGRAAQSQLEEARAQVRETRDQVLQAQKQVEEFRNRAREAESQAQKIQAQSSDVSSQMQATQNEVHGAENQVRKTRRLTKALALIAVLTLLAASLAATIAWRQRLIARQALAKADSEAIWGPDWVPPGRMDQSQVRQALVKIGGTEQNTNQWHSLDQLATWIPTSEIPGALKASSVILNGQQRSHFQKWLLLRQGWVNPLSAMTNAGAIRGDVMNDAGLSDSNACLQLAVLDNWMKMDLPGAFDWVCHVSDIGTRQRALEKIIPALPVGNYTNTLARLNALQPPPAETIYTLFFQHWAASNAVQAIEHRRRTPDHDAGDKILHTIMTAWMAQQPDAALSWVKDQPESETKNRAMAACIQELATTDVAQAVSLAESLPEGVWRNKVVAGLFTDWAKRDLKAARTACQQLPEGAAKANAWECVLNQQIEDDPASAAESVKNLEPGDYRHKAIAELAPRWARADAQAALTWAQSLPSETEQAFAQNQIVVAWAQKNPQAAMQFAGQHPALSGAALGEIAEALSRNDWSAATNWVENLSDEGKRDVALSALLQTWVQKDPTGMAKYALNLPIGKTQTQYLTAVCRQLAVHDFPETVKLLQQLPAAALRWNLLEQAAHDCDLLHLHQAAKSIAAMPAGDDQQAAIKGLLSRWAPADPGAALNWLCSLPETNAQPEQIQSVIKAWTQHEPAAAAKWLAKRPSETTSNGIVSAFLEGSVEKYPAFAAEWTQSLTNETRRQTFQIQVARQWLKTDPSAAEKWINSLNLPKETAQSLEQ